jgi:hypothetical protein
VPSVSPGRARDRGEDAASLRRRRLAHRVARSAVVEEQIPPARIEMSPDLGHDLLVPLWPRVLRHLAPATLR